MENALARESMSAKRARAIEIEDRMQEYYPDPECALTYWKDPFRLLIAVMLSAQTTDAGVNKVTPILWERYPTIADLAQADIGEVASIISTIGCYRVKAKNAVGIAQMILADFGGEVPCDMDKLQKLPGVGRKTANIVMNEGFGIVEGIAVDTHVNRIAHRLKLVPADDDPSKTEQALLKLYPLKYWGRINHEWVLFGRQICMARNPKCCECFEADLCPSCLCK